MKNKPLRHKESNTFKFIPFSERVAEVKIDVVHHVKHRYELEADDTTFFYQTYEKWILLNCSQSFEELRQDITTDIRTLPQLLARKDELAKVLKYHLSLHNAFNLQAVLEFIVAFAKDIRQEFYPYFSDFYPLLISLLTGKDAEQLEWVFQCLANLFKYLWRYLLNNLTSVYDSLLPLLDQSRPDYINSFAAQSFAFVARKIKDETKLVKLIVKPLKENPQAVKGCGRLLFEIVRGIPGHFHSGGEKFLAAFISALGNTSYTYSSLCELLSETLSHLVPFIHINQVGVLWKILLDSLEKFHIESKQAKSERNIGNVEQLLCMIQQTVEFKSGLQLVDPNSVITLLLKLLQPDNQVCNQITDRTSQILAFILLSSKNLPQELSSRIVVAAISYLSEEDLLTFVIRIRTYSAFDGLVLPRLLSFCKEKSSPKVALPYLTQLVVHRAPPPSDTQQLLLWNPYSLTFSSQKNEDGACCNNYLMLFSQRDLNEHLEEFDDCIRILLILPHILPLQKHEAILSLKTFIEDICSDLSEIKTVNSLPKLLFMLSLAIETIINLKSDVCITKLILPDLILPILLKYSCYKYLYVLRALDFYLTLDELNEAKNYFVEIKKCLNPLLLCPYQKVRLHVTHILYEIEKSYGENEIASSVLETCWLAECIPVTLSDYREKLKILQKLDCSNEVLKNLIARNLVDGRIPLSYLMGVMFLNFRLLWDPVSKIIISYGSVLTPNAFWDIFGKQLEDVTCNIREHMLESPPSLPLKCDVLIEQFTKLNNLSETPDYVNYRINAFNILKDIPEVYEFKSKDIVISFLNFIEKEYNKIYSEAAYSWDIRLNKFNGSFELSTSKSFYKLNSSELFNVENEVEMKETAGSNVNEDKSESNLEGTNETDIDNNAVEDDEVKDDSIFENLNEDLPELEWKTKWVTKSLLAHMSIFGKFRSPKSLYREPDLNKLFYDFLSSRVADIQRCALDFIMSYKHKYLIPYKDHLYGLIDDKNFRNELTLFRIDTESELVREEHRPYLIPVVLRIVYSKMFSKVCSSRRETRHARKAAIIRFLAGCSADELKNFFNMAFNFIISFVEDSCEPMVDKILNSIRLEDCLPPRRLLTTAYLMKTIIAHCGGILPLEQTSRLFRLILVVGAYPTYILNRRDTVHPGYVKVLKNVRLVCFNALMHFSEVFENYMWSEDEVNGMFKVMVWPYLDNMTTECVSSPTALLRLFIVWSKHPRFILLLNKKNFLERSPLSTIIELWSLPKLHLSVHNALLEIIYNLITNNGENENLSLGVQLLNPYMPDLMELLQKRFCKRKFLSKKELAVLSTVSSSDSTNISPESLLSVVLPSLLKSKNNIEEIPDLLNTVGNLVIKTDHSEKYLKQIVKLFSVLQTPTHRKLLLSKVFDISKHCGINLSEDVLSDLNAWDPKWVEQPDFNRRLQAFLTIEHSNFPGPSIFAAIVIRTSYLFLKDEKDLSLKDSARHCLRTLCPKLCVYFAENRDELSYILDETIFPLIKSGLGDDSEIICQECISLLGCLVRDGGNVHFILKDLFPFSNSADLEVDFFENIVHLQLHRRVRAMLRLSEILDDLETVIHPQTLMFYILPMISRYLLSKKYSDKNTIIDSAIKALGSICRSLPWRFYYAILKLHLGKLQLETDFQKQLIRIVSEILNSFHFNLSQADEFRGSSTQLIDCKVSGENLIASSHQEYESNLEESLLDEVKENNITFVDQNIRRDVTLDKPSANKIVFELAGVILPNLQKVLGDKSNADSFHKVNKKIVYNEKDEDDLLRIPLSIAIVKLLQKLPSPILLERNLSGIFLKLANYLKSRVESVRKSAKNTLEAIMMSLGTKYLHHMISELCSLLTRGFHVHVLTYTLHGVLSKLKTCYSKGDLDPSLNKILSVCISDIFGSVSEEKEVKQITAKTPEARATKSFDVFKILGTYCSENYLLNLVLPLKKELSNSVSHKTIKKATDCLQQLALGLTENQFLSPESLLEFAYGLSSESIPALTSKEEEKLDYKLKEYESRKGPNPYLIPEEPKKKKALMTSECMKTNAHILVEFGLKLLYFLLKREKLNKQQFKPMLEPLVKHLIDCLESKHVKVSCVALKCFSWVLRMDLPSTEANINEISSVFLEILHRYAAAGLSKGDNFDLVMAAFKAVGVLVRSCKSWKPNKEDIRVLLLYCEQDIDDRERQATAFSLLKALIQKGVSSKELNSVMKKVANVSIISPIGSVRLQARQVMLTYIMEYRIREQLVTFLSFYLSQLAYQTKIGRESSLEMIRMLVSSFPQETLNEESGLIYVNVATRLVNEEDVDCKKEVAALIIQLIQKLEQNSRDKLFDVTTAWITGRKILHRRLGMQLAGLFATAENDKFKRRLETFFSLATSEVSSGFNDNRPGRFVLLKNQDISDNSHHSDNAADDLAFHTLQAIIKVFTLFPETLQDNKYCDKVQIIQDECQSMLAHDHEWVRTLAMQILGLILTTKQERGSKSLALDLVSQLMPSVGEPLLMQSMKLLVHVAEMSSLCPSEENEFNLQWLIRKVRQAVNREIIHSPTSTQIRKMACRWGAALSVKLKREILLKVAFELLTPIIKSMSSEDYELAKASKEAGGYFKGKLGQTEYNNLVSRISQNIEAKKAVRKKERNQLAVIDPERAAKRKINRQIKKKALKKRKVELMKDHKFKPKLKKTEIILDM